MFLDFRWSAIAARLPGRTDNEIKNVWHTHLKKRLRQNYATPQLRNYPVMNEEESIAQQPFKYTNYGSMPSSALAFSPPHCSSESSSIITAENGESWTNNLPEADENFWREVLGSDQMATVGNQQGFEGETSERQLGNLTNEQPTHETTDFWTIFFQEEGIYLS